jgi:FkbM family methyltransferase
MPENQTQLTSMAQNTSAHFPWQRSRSSTYAAVKALLLAISGHSGASSILDAVRGHRALIRLTNIHDNLLSACRKLSCDQEGRVLWATPFGEIWTPAEASAKYLAGIIAEQMVECYSYPLLPAIQGEVIIDCGANVGMYTRHAVNRGARLVVAVEPSSENAICFRRNLAAEIQSGRVILLENALSDAAGELWLDTSNRRNPGSWSVSGVAGPHRDRVAVKTVDQIVDDLSLPRVDRLKIDVEGHEVQVVRGARATLTRFRPNFVLAVEHANEDVPEVIAALDGIDVIHGRYRFHSGLHRCDEHRRLHPQVLYWISQNRMAS